MGKNALTLTAVANMTSNYSENLGNVSSVQKVFRNGKTYSMRSRESLKNAIMVQSGMYDDLQTQVDGATQKLVNEEVNVSNNRALEGGYMSTKGNTYIRKSSFYLTDAVSCESFVNESRFHNNLYLASNYAASNKINLQANAKETGLMPYQYEYDKSLKVYSITIDLQMIGKDNNFEAEEASSEEKAIRVNSILTAIENLSLIVKGNLDNAEPLFIVGGLSERKTHYFENLVRVKENKVEVSEDLIKRKEEGFQAGLLKGMNFENENEIIQKLNPIAMPQFFEVLKKQINEYYGC
ncbi:type I-B CRISPR-associated protein Cas7/Cst2/DevR [Konateibacter massiliensis]|uniref:type I-B CRISPR-associated protein Cas7/Cst2/DevR n=1 Tax=Konateibacter massiliensis TaxID=2002841 RepID=UPI000C15F104|nr:type I-B CRISPR-associated protein Cas7/Cst2/DevR [Konateibacter massiliensis]